MARERRPELLAPILAEASGSTARLNIYGYFDQDGAPYGVSADEFGKVVADLPDDTDTIELHIHSRGGDVFEAVAVAQQLREHKATVNATVDGIAASAASFVAASADKLTMTPDSSLMIHNGSVSLFLASLDAEACAKLANGLSHVNDKMAAIYAAKAGGSAEEWRAAMAVEQWYSADEAVTAGLADAKSAGRNAAPAAVAALDLSIFAYAGRDAAPEPFIPTAPQTPAEPPVTPPTDHKEADTMSDTLSKGLRERLGVTDETLDDDGLLAALDETLAEQTEPPAPAASVEDQSSEVAILRRELESTQAQLGQIVAGNTAAAKARTFAEAFDRGVIGGPEDPERIQFEADYDTAPEVIGRILAGRADGSKFPVKAAGYTSDPAAAAANPAAGDDYWFPGRPVPSVTATKEH